MYINFQQNRVSNVKTVHTNLFEKNCKLHTFATTNSNFEKIDYLRHASSYNVHVYQFSAKSGWFINHTRAHKFIRKKLRSCINLQLPIVFF